MALQPWRKGIVIKIENETPDTRRFYIQIPEISTFEFIPGQFITLDLPIHEKSNKRWRSYSIASWPDGSNVIELLIVLNPDGLGTPYLFNEIKVGSELTLRGPQGVFVLNQPLEKDLFLICTGTGIAPFRSMVRDILNKNIPHQQIHLVFGCRKKENLLYYPEMKELEDQLSGFHFHPTLSREEWEGKSGYVHDVYESLIKEHKPTQFYLCGWKLMIDDAKNKIVALGYDKKDIHIELYG